MNKKLLALLTIICALCCAFGIAACNLGGESNSGTNDNDTQHNHGAYYTEWTRGLTEHWYDCRIADCDYKKDKSEHEDSDDNHICDICGANFDGELAFEEIKDGEEVVAYAVQGLGTFNIDEIIIPSEHNGKPVTAISRNAFDQCESIINISIPESITNIGVGAFDCCYKLHYYKYDNAQYLGNENNPYFAVIDYFNNATTNTCSIKNSCKIIAEYAFWNANITSITIPDSVTNIGKTQFGYECSLTSITVTNGNSKYHSTGNCLIETKSKTLLFGCKNSVIPSDGSVTSIGYEAFYGCNGLTSITIPDSVTNIGDSAFYSCSGLTNITIGSGVVSIGEHAFYDCDGLTSIKVDENNIEYLSQDGILYNKTESNFVHIPKAIKGAVTILDGVTMISYEAFSGCSGLTSVAIPDSVKYIMKHAFEYCNGLTSITIENSLVSIDCEAFEYCNDITSIKFEGSKAQWKAIFKLDDWNKNTGNFTIQCTDGKLDKDGNEIE